MNSAAGGIEQLLTSTNLPAPGVTCPLKKIGNGNMLDGVRKIYGQGFSKGTIVGGATVGGVVLVVYGTYKLADKYFTKKKTTKKEDIKCKRRNGTVPL